MPIFISYNHEDRAFVDTLAANLVKLRHNVWLDRWEMSVGDSLIERVQAALTASSAVLVVLSKNSVNSEWCKKELNSTLMREIAEKKALLMPCVIDDCDISLFLREKVYADFRKDPDAALAELDRALAKISSLDQGRSETPDFYTDWSYDWTREETGGNWIIDWSFVDHGPNVPYVILTRMVFLCDEAATKRFDAALAQDRHADLVMELADVYLGRLAETGNKTVLIDSAREKFGLMSCRTAKGEGVLVRTSCRRMGDDTGMDTVFHIDLTLGRAVETLRERQAKA